MKKLIFLCTTALIPTAAFAQSTGSVDFEKDAVIITGKRQKDVGGVEIPDTPKAQVALTQEIISRQTPGQSILDTINLIPGVSFQNNDPYGSAGGNLTIRGFDSSRISLTFDGIPLNDSGNYAIYSNQQLDPELIEQVNVNLGSTDVDSPTASAVGGTVNYRTIVPTERFGVRALGSIGSLHFRRVFGLINTGAIGPWGTRMFVSASKADNHVPFNNYGKVDKQQYNARIWQPIGSNGDFISLAGNYNENRNNFFGSVALRFDRDVPSGFPTSRRDRKYKVDPYPCTISPAVAGAADKPNSCGTSFDRRFNPSNTGNLRGSSKFTLTDKLVLTVDPSFQYVKANGGGTTTGNEKSFDVTGTPSFGFFNGRPYYGIDLNGDGDTLDTVTVLQPSQTETHRYGVIVGARYEINPTNAIRFGYTLDYARHRQTGSTGLLKASGTPQDVFAINDPIADANGIAPNKRDRLSFAILNQVAAEYRGVFNQLQVNVGLRLPFFTRRLHNYCFTTSASGFLDCPDGDAAVAAYAAAHPTTQGPQERTLKYNKALPNIGAVYAFTPTMSVFASYAKGLSVPGTDNLYNSFFFAPDVSEAKPKPETTDSFDAGFRYRSSRVQAQISPWYTFFKDRSASAYDPVLDRTVYRNLGAVDKYGVDVSAAYSPTRQFTFYAFGSLLRSKIKDDVQTGAFPVGVTSCANAPANASYCAFTSGKFESGAPKYTYGASVAAHLGDFELGATAKRTGPRYVFDTNRPVFSGATQIYPSKAPSYTLVSLDARYRLDHILPALAGSYLQFNVFNLFDKLYVGGFGGGLTGGAPFVQIGAPRAFIGSLNIAFGGDRGASPPPPPIANIPPPPPPIEAAPMVEQAPPPPPVTSGERGE